MESPSSSALRSSDNNTTDTTTTTTQRIDPLHHVRIPLPPAALSCAPAVAGNDSDDDGGTVGESTALLLSSADPKTMASNNNACMNTCHAPKAGDDASKILVVGVSDADVRTDGSDEASSSPSSSSPKDDDHREEKKKSNNDNAIHIHFPIRFRILLGVTSATMAISSSTISLFAVNVINLEPVQLTHYWMFQSWSSLLNPVIGFLSDTVMIYGENRRPLVVLGAVGIATIFFLFAFVDITTSSYTFFVALSMLQSWGQSLIAVPLNGMLVEMFLEDAYNNNNNTNTSSQRAGGSSAAAEGAEKARLIAGGSCGDAVDAEAKAAMTTTTAFPSAEEQEQQQQQLLEEEERRKKKAADRQIAVMSLVQADAMVYRSLGSLGGSILYTVAVIWVPLTSMLWVSAIAYTLIVPSVLSLSHKWCRAPVVRRREEAAERRRQGRGGSNSDTNARTAQEEEEDAYYRQYEEDEANQKKSLGLTERCMQCSRQFKTIYDRLSLGWDWRNPSQGTIGLVLVLVFVFIYSGTLDGGSVYFSFVATQFEFPNWLNSLNMCVGMLGSVVGAYVYGGLIGWLHRRAVRKEAERKQRAEEEEAAAASASFPQGGGGVGSSGVAIPSSSLQSPTTTSRSSTANTHHHHHNHTRITTAFNIFLFGSICGALGYMTNVVLATDLIPRVIPIPPYLFVPVDNFVTSVFSRFAFMPIMTVAAERCPQGYEAAVFELFAVASMLGGSLSAFLTGKVATWLSITSKDYSQLWILLCVCAGVKFVPVIVAALLPVHEKSATAMLVAAISEAKDATINTNNVSAAAKDDSARRGVSSNVEE